MKTDILIFDVGLGQSIFLFPHTHPEYGSLIDCGNAPGFEPIDFLIRKGYIKNNTLHNLLLTNYDQDHFSGLPYLRSKVHIRTVQFAQNLSSQEIKELKESQTDALEHVCYVKDTYTNPVTDYDPPYKSYVYHLHKTHFEGDHDTNNLSQMVFFEQFGTIVCISGDLEQKGWELLLATNPEIKVLLRRTNIFVASHHGRENGYYPEVFEFCSPECIVISDKGIVHDTQRDMSSVYGTHVASNGIIFNGGTSRKVLTTRDDGHIYIQLHADGRRIYSNFTH